MQKLVLRATRCVVSGRLVKPAATGLAPHVASGDWLGVSMDQITFDSTTQQCATARRQQRHEHQHHLQRQHSTTTTTAATPQITNNANTNSNNAITTTTTTTNNRLLAVCRVEVNKLRTLQYNLDARLDRVRLKAMVSLSFCPNWGLLGTGPIPLFCACCYFFKRSYYGHDQNPTHSVSLLSLHPKEISLALWSLAARQGEGASISNSMRRSRRCSAKQSIRKYD